MPWIKVTVSQKRALCTSSLQAATWWEKNREYSTRTLVDSLPRSLYVLDVFRPSTRDWAQSHTSCTHGYLLMLEEGSPTFHAVASQNTISLIHSVLFTHERLSSEIVSTNNLQSNWLVLKLARIIEHSRLKNPCWQSFCMFTFNLCREVSSTAFFPTSLDASVWRPSRRHSRLLNRWPTEGTSI